MGILVLLVVGGFVTFLVLNATKRSDHATATDDDSELPGVGADDSPLGDTQQHAGQQDREGQTVAGADTRTPGGTGRPVEGGSGDGRFQRDPVGGEAEARPFTESER